jgi:hypothetical protein
MIARAFGANKTMLKSEADDFENFDVNLSAMSLSYFQSYEGYQEWVRKRFEPKKAREARDVEAEQAHTIYGGKTDWVDDKTGVTTFSLKHFCVLEDFKIEGLL